MARRKQAKTIEPPAANYLVMKKIQALNTLDFADRIEAANAYRCWVRFENGQERRYLLPSGKRLVINGKEQITIEWGQTMTQSKDMFIREGDVVGVKNTKNKVIATEKVVYLPNCDFQDDCWIIDDGNYYIHIPASQAVLMKKKEQQ